MSVENIVKTGFRVWFKAIKMMPGTCLKLARIYYEHRVSGSDWGLRAEKLYSNNREVLEPFIEEFKYSIDYTLGTTLFGEQTFVDKSYGKSISQRGDARRKIISGGVIQKEEV